MFSIKVPCRTSHLSDAVSPVNKDLADITRWCYKNSLLENPDKTKVLFVGVPQLLRSLPLLPPVMLSGQEIKPYHLQKILE